MDSKLLLAILAASRGHQVIVSDQESIIKGLVRKFLFPGIFHTKSITPGKPKIEKHKRIKNTGCKITSIDEEGGLVDYKYDKFAKIRYGAQTLRQASAVFTWGLDDCNSLKKIYPKFSKKIYLTGSPRADLWQPFFFSYWKKKDKKFKKPYLLISSNFISGLHMKTLYERMRVFEVGGYLKRDPELLKIIMPRESEKIKLVALFIEAIKYLSSNKKQKYKIILRPHQTENAKLWKIFLNGVSDVEVIKDDSISFWVNNAFAVMHHSCTTALEARLAKKPVISYVPFNLEYSEKKLPLDISYKVKDLKKLTRKINTIFYQSKLKNKNNKFDSLPKILRKKIFIDKKELAASKIINVWEKLGDESLSKPNNWALFKLSLKIMKFNGILGRFIKKFTNSNFQNKENFKFPPFNEKNVFDKIQKLQKVLGIKKKIDCQLLSDRTLLIKQK
ncbi:hypothetical protein IDG99_00145 [Pelagibacterales bacterium SAG-MED09]|nr:hypothetical protein [Pelagibacterales bacterium SAG-MED09]